MSKSSGKVLFRENMLATYKNVVSNKGASGVDNVTVDEIKKYVNQN